MDRVSFQRNLNALLVWILSAILLSAYSVQFIFKEEPCPLCMLQRLGMFGVSIGALLNVCFRIHPAHYAVILVSSLFGGLVALRQISLHVCPGFSTFGMPVLGLSLYTWSFLIFACCIAGTAFLLFLVNPKQVSEPQGELNLFCKSAFLAIFLLAAANVLTTLWQCGFGPCE